MALGERWSKSVVFITGQFAEADEPKPLGTGFITGFRSEADPDQGFAYVITAAHVVRSLAASFVRLTKPDGTTLDHAVDEWIFHPTEDVAVCRLPPPYSDHEFYVVEAGEFVGAKEYKWEPRPGADVFFAGLLGQVPSMGEQNVPMVRTGSIGAMYQDGIPMRMPGDIFITVHGHLIDCQSFGGFSGSPCFVRFISGRGETEHLSLTYPEESTLLLGMLGGHFDLKASIALPDQENKLDIPVAAGVAVVYPAEKIREILDEEVLVHEREGLENELREQGQDDP